MRTPLTTVVASVTTLAIAASNAVYPITPAVPAAASFAARPLDRFVARIGFVGYIHQHRPNSGPFDDLACPIPAARTPTGTKERS